MQTNETPNFKLIPNLKTKLRKRALIKSYFEKTSKTAVFREIYFIFHAVFYLNFVFGFGISVKFGVLVVPILTYLKKKMFSALFGEK